MGPVPSMILYPCQYNISTCIFGEGLTGRRLPGAHPRPLVMPLLHIPAPLPWISQAKGRQALADIPIRPPSITGSHHGRPRGACPPQESQSGFQTRRSPIRPRSENRRLHIVWPSARRLATPGKTVQCYFLQRNKSRVMHASVYEAWPSWHSSPSHP